jgi:hypothetical protein
MQLLKASALLPAPESAASRSQSYASRLKVLALLLSLFAVPLSYGGDRYGRGAAQPASKMIAAMNASFMNFPRSSLLSFLIRYAIMLRYFALEPRVWQ